MSDLISREYMKSLGATCIASRSKDGNMFPIVSIDELPSVQPKERCVATVTLSEEDIERIVKAQVEEIKDSLPRKGKWIKDNPHSEIYRYACSECHAHHRARYDFCPSCGCRMEEGDSE